MFPLPALLLLVASTASAATEALPPGWRLPIGADDRTTVEDRSPQRPVRAIGDFNGDGVPDTALLLVSESSGSESLWVKLSTGQRAHRLVRVDAQSSSNVPPVAPLKMSVSTRAPGRVLYACFDEDAACQVGTNERRRTLNLKNPAILYFMPEGAASLYFWSNTKKKFVRVWLSD